MKMKILSIVAVLLVSTLVAGDAFSYGDGCHTGKGWWHGKEKKEAIASKLNLTAEQDKQLQETKGAHRAQMSKLRESLKAKRGELKDALAKPGATKEAVAPIISDIKNLQSQMLDIKVDGILNVKKILTPEQFQKMQEMKSGHKNCGSNYRPKDRR